MWTRYFTFIKLRRGTVITPSHGEIDFSRDDIPVNTCKELYELKFPYLEITEEGKKELYGEEQDTIIEESDQVFEELPPADENPEKEKESVPKKKKKNKGT